MFKKFSVAAFSFLTWSLVTQASVGAGSANTANYYDQFLYKIDGDCSEIRTVWFHQATTWTFSSIGKDVSGRDSFFGLSLQLFPNGTYYAEYEELSTLDSHLETVTYESTFKKPISGRWIVNGNIISLQGLGSGMPSQLPMTAFSTPQDAIGFKLDRPIHNHRVAGVVLNLVKTSTNLGPRGVSINKFCGRN